MSEDRKKLQKYMTKSEKEEYSEDYQQMAAESRLKKASKKVADENRKKRQNAGNYTAGEKLALGYGSALKKSLNYVKNLGASNPATQKGTPKSKDNNK